MTTFSKNTLMSAGEPSAEQPPLLDLDVAQKQYGFARVGVHAAIQTGDVNTCTGLVAIDRAQGLVFMMHVDVPWFDGSVRSALLELRNRCSGHLKDVELLDLAGVTPKQVLLLTAAFAAILAAFGVWQTEPGFALALTLVIPIFLFSARTRVYWMLWRLGFTFPDMLTRKMAKEWRWWHAPCAANIRIPLTGPGKFEPEVQRACWSRDKRWEVPKVAAGWNLWKRLRANARLTRAEGSLREGE